MRADTFHAFNGRRNGLLSCGELAAGLGWLGVSLQEGELHALMKGLDTDGDGLLSIEEWAAGFPGLPETEAATQEMLSSLALQPKPVREVFEEASGRPKARAQPVPPMALIKFKFKMQAHKGFTPVWTNKGSGARDELSIWAPDFEGQSLHKKSKARMCLGYYVTPALVGPAKGARAPPLVLEVSDTGASMVRATE